MKDGIIIQARTGSTRLHNKILLPFYGEQRIIDILIANIKQACPDKCIVLATTNRPQDDVLAETARQALSASRLIVTNDLAQCVAISNQYGPEHLIIQTRNARDLVDGITSAGSVFLGDWSPESAGDYASGTNHVLPTYGYTATCSSLGLADFQKRMTVQELSKVGFSALASTIETLAAAERLTAHKNAVTLRVNALKEQA